MRPVHFNALWAGMLGALTVVFTYGAIANFNVKHVMFVLCTALLTYAVWRNREQPVMWTACTGWLFVIYVAFLA